MSDEHKVAEAAAIKERLTKESKESGTCVAFKVFNLGSNGTVYAACGLHEYHDKYGEESIMYHIASQRFDDGSVVTFKWPL